MSGLLLNAEGLSGVSSSQPLNMPRAPSRFKYIKIEFRTFLNLDSSLQLHAVRNPVLLMTPSFI